MYFLKQPFVTPSGFFNHRGPLQILVLFNAVRDVSSELLILESIVLVCSVDVLSKIGLVSLLGVEVGFQFDVNLITLLLFLVRLLIPLVGTVSPRISIAFRITPVINLSWRTHDLLFGFFLRKTILSATQAGIDSVPLYLIHLLNRLLSFPETSPSSLQILCISFFFHKYLKLITIITKLQFQ